MRRSHAALARLLFVTVLFTSVGAAAPAAAMTGGAAPSALSPREARTDRELLWSNGCLAVESTTSPKSTCVFGVDDSSFTLALIGDSHASHLFAAFERLAIQRGWRLVVYVKVSCPFLDIPIRNYFSGAEYTQCATWNTNMLAKLRRIKPDLTVTVVFRGIHPMDPAKDTPTREGAAVGRMLAKVPGRRAIIVDTPYSYRDIPSCLEQYPSDPSLCRIPSSQVWSSGVGSRERKAAAVGGATYVDLTAAICAGSPCRVVRKGVVMFRDRHHLTNTYAATLRNPIGAALDRVLD